VTRAWPPDDTFAHSIRTWPPPRATGQRVPSNRLLASFTQVDPGIQSGVVDGAAVSSSIWPGGRFINATLINPGTISDLPSNGLRWTVPSKTTKGIVRGTNIEDLVQGCFGFTSDADPICADLILGWFLTNGTVGFGGGLLSTGAAGDWQVFALNQVAGTWTRTAGGAAVATTVGSIAQCEPSNGANLRLLRVLALNGTATELPAASGAAPAGVLTLANGLATFGLYCGWATGVGGVGGTTVKIAGAELISDPLNAGWLTGT
jgi:hypothetical protein